MGLPSCPFVQTAIRWRNDDGSQTTATWKATENTNITVTNAQFNTNVRLRLQTDTNNGCVSCSTITARRLEFNLNSGGWTQITTSTSPVKLTTTSNYTDGDVTTGQLSNPNGDGFIAGQCKSTGSDTTTDTFGSSTYTEDEYCFQVTTGNNADVIQFRLTKAGTTYNTYTHLAQITLSVTSSGGDLFPIIMM